VREGKNQNEPAIITDRQKFHQQRFFFIPDTVGGGAKARNWIVDPSFYIFSVTKFVIRVRANAY